MKSQEEKQDKEKPVLKVLFSVDDVHPEIGYGLYKEKDNFKYLLDLNKEFGLKFTLFMVPKWEGYEDLNILKYPEWIDWIKQKPFFEIAAHGLTHKAKNEQYKHLEMLPLSFEETKKVLTESKETFLKLGINIAGWKCFSEDTEYLTEKGWKTFNEIKKEKIATVNIRTHKIEYQSFLNRYSYDYDDNLIQIGGKRSMDALVTPNHNMLIEERKEKNKLWKLVEAQKLNNNHNIIRNGIWEGKEQKYFLYKTLKFKMEDWLQLFAWFISEGSCDIKNNRITIYQTKKHMITKINKLLKHMKLNTSKVKDGIRFTSKEITEFIKQYNLQGSINKYIPNEFKNLSLNQIKILVDTLICGDGEIRDNGGRRYYTISKRLADDIQELFIKLGKSTNMIIHKQKGKLVNLSPYKHHSNYDVYVVSEYKVNRSASIRRKLGSLQLVPYKGKVCCFETPNKTLIVRRNGKPFMCGNSPGWLHNNNIYEALKQTGYWWIADHVFGEIPITLSNGMIQVPYNCSTEELEFAYPEKVAILHSHISPNNNNQNGWTELRYQQTRQFLLKLLEKYDFIPMTFSEYINSLEEENGKNSDKS